MYMSSIVVTMGYLLFTWCWMVSQKNIEMGKNMLNLTDLCVREI